MKDNDFDQHLRDNIQSLDNEPLPGSIWDKEQTWNRINEKRGRKKRRLFPYTAAAAIVLLLVSGFLANEFYQQHLMVKTLRKKHEKLIRENSQHEIRLRKYEKKLDEIMSNQSNKGPVIQQEIVYQTVIVHDTIIRDSWKKEIVYVPDTANDVEKQIADKVPATITLAVDDSLTADHSEETIPTKEAQTFYLSEQNKKEEKQRSKFRIRFGFSQSGDDHRNTSDAGELSLKLTAKLH